MPDLQIKSRADHDRIRQRSAKKHKTNAAIADAAVRIVIEHRQGRSAQACMADLDKAAREIGR